MTETETLFNGRWLRMVRRGTWEYAERTNAGGGAVIVVAVTPQDEVLFVEQFRVPIQQHTIEMPAGLIGDEAGLEHEDAVATAARELEEETGYRAGRVEYVMSGPTSAGMRFTEVDIARIHLIQQLKDDLGANDEGIGVILHLMDQLHGMRRALGRMRDEMKRPSN